MCIAVDFGNLFSCVFEIKRVLLILFLYTLNNTADLCSSCVRVVL